MRRRVLVRVGGRRSARGQCRLKCEQLEDRTTPTVTALEGLLAPEPPGDNSQITFLDPIPAIVAGVSPDSPSLRIDATHPSLPGHFPGDPIVPGVVLLDRVAACLEQAGYGVAKLSTVKFLAPLRPGEDATLRFDGDAQRLRFRVERAGTPILSGEAVLA